MAKRRIVLSSQEMTDIKKRIQTLESQLSRSNARVAELESGLNKLNKVTSSKKFKTTAGDFAEELIAMIGKTINPPVAAREPTEFELAEETA